MGSGKGDDRGVPGQLWVDKQLRVSVESWGVCSDDPAQVIQTSSPRVQERGFHGAEGHCHSVEFRSLRHSMLSTQETPKPAAWTGLFSSQPCSPQPSCLQMMDMEVSFRVLLHTAPHVPL